MNLLAHLWLAHRTGTSAAGQILGDMVKGRLDTPRFNSCLDHGIRLHRRIDGFTDAHPAHQRMRACFKPPLRRYAGILVDIGFDHALALRWPDFHDDPLPVFAEHMELQVIREWPDDAPLPARRMSGLSAILSGNAERKGIARALQSVSRRLSRHNPVAEATDAVLALQPGFGAELEALLRDLEAELVQFQHDRPAR